MTDRDSLARAVRLARTLLLLALLLFPWPGLGGVFVSAFSWVFDVLVPGAKLHPAALELARLPPATLSPVSRPNPSWYAVVELAAGSGGETIRAGMNLRAMAYVPLAIFVAMAVSLPMARGRTRLAAWGLGAAFVGLFVIVNLAVPVLLLLGDPRRNGIAMTDGMRNILQAAFSALAETSIATPVLLTLFASQIAGAWMDVGRGSRAPPAR